MERKKPIKKKLSDQMKTSAKKEVKAKKEYDGNLEQMISTGSTLLDLEICGGRKRGGGLPGGILVEIFGPSGSGKTVLLSEIGGGIQRTGGDILFHDPEARLNKQFAAMFGITIKPENYTTPDTVVEVFTQVRAWEPQPEKKKAVNGILADSLAALSTELEMGKDEGDKMGMKRAKDFSEQLRKTARIITANNLLMVCSNQVRVNADAGPYGQKYESPGGVAIGFYASVRLRASNPQKIYKIEKIAGKELKKVIGVETTFEVFKNSTWKPYGKAPVYILFDYGIDDIRANLKFIKDYTRNTVFGLRDRLLDKSMEVSISIVEEEGLEQQLKEDVIDLWEEIQKKFESGRKKIR